MNVIKVSEMFSTRHGGHAPSTLKCICAVKVFSNRFLDWMEDCPQRFLFNQAPQLIVLPLNEGKMLSL